MLNIRIKNDFRQSVVTDQIIFHTWKPGLKTKRYSWIFRYDFHRIAYIFYLKRLF